MQPIELFVPGRLCIIGEHSDWAANYGYHSGHAIVAPTDQGIHAKVVSDQNLKVQSSMKDGTHLGPVTVKMELDELLREAKSGSFFSYIAGVAYIVKSRYPQVGGIFLDNYKTSLPIQKGLSSSAAVCVLVAQSFNSIYDLKMTIESVMDIAYEGERLTGSLCGRMDQVCAYNKFVHIEFTPTGIKSTPMEVKEPMYFVLVELRGKKDTKKILSDLNAGYQRALDNKHQNDLHTFLGDQNHKIVQQAISAINDGHHENFGKLITQWQQLFDTHAAPLCVEELTSPKLHSVLNDKDVMQLAWGGKGVGSQGDGTAQFLVKSKEQQENLAKLIESKFSMPCLSLCVLPSCSNTNKLL